MSKSSLGKGTYKTDLKMENAPENLKTPTSHLQVVLPEWTKIMFISTITLPLFTSFPSIKLYIKSLGNNETRMKGLQQTVVKGIQ